MKLAVVIMWVTVSSMYLKNLRNLLIDWLIDIDGITVKYLDLEIQMQFSENHEHHSQSSRVLTISTLNSKLNQTRKHKYHWIIELNYLIELGHGKFVLIDAWCMTERLILVNIVRHILVVPSPSVTHSRMTLVDPFWCTPIADSILPMYTLYSLCTARV